MRPVKLSIPKPSSFTPRARHCHNMTQERITNQSLWDSASSQEKLEAKTLKPQTKQERDDMAQTAEALLESDCPEAARKYNLRVEAYDKQ